MNEFKYKSKKGQSIRQNELILSIQEVLYLETSSGKGFDIMYQMLSKIQEG